MGLFMLRAMMADLVLLMYGQMIMTKVRAGHTGAISVRMIQTVFDCLPEKQIHDKILKRAEELDAADAGADPENGG